MITTVKAIITADSTQFQKTISTASSRLEKFGAKTAATGKLLTKKLTMPIGLVGGASIKMASDFDASMKKIESLVGLSSEAVEAFEKDVKSLSGETAQAPKDLADAMFFITSAGIRGAAATETLAASAKAAAIGLGDTATIADLATSALNAYGEENLSATQATDVMVAAVREGKLEASELAGSMGRVLPIASAMGVGFNEVGAAFAALSRTGTNAAEASTQVRGILASILRPTKQAKEALNGMGLTFGGLREQLKEKGLLSVLKTLGERFDGQTDKAAAVFGNIRALSGVMDLLGKNSAGTEAIFASMVDTTGALDDAFGVTSETTAFKLSQAMADMKLALIRIGEVLIPIVVPIIEKLAGAIATLGEGFQKMPSPMKKVTAAFILLAAAAGPAMKIIGTGMIGIGKTGGAMAKLGKSAGAVGGKGLVGRMGSLLKVVKGHPVAFAALGVGMFAASKIIGGMRKRAQEARERMSTLREEFIAAGDPTTTLKDRVMKLAESLQAVEKATGGAETATEGFVGEQTLMAELLKQDVTGAFFDAGFNMEELTTAMSTGSDEFERLKKEAKNSYVTTDVFTESLRNADAKVVGVTSHLADLIDNEIITREEAEKLLYSMDETADAFDDNRKDLEKINEEYLKSEGALKSIRGALGDYGVKLLDAAGDTMTYTAAMNEINDALEKKKAVQDGVNEEVRRFGNLIPTVTQSLETEIDVEAELIESQEELEASMKLTEERVQRVRDQFDALVSSMSDTITEAFELDEAQIGLQNAMLGVLDALEKQNDEEATALEKQEALVTASKNYATNLGTLAETMAGMSLAEINTEFENQAGFLDSIKDTMPLSEYERLEELLGEIHTDAQNLHGTEIAVGLGITVDYDASMLGFLDLVNSYGNVADFGASVAMGIGTGTYSGAGLALPAFASGGIVTKPTLGLIGEAGPEAVVPLNQMGGMGTTVNVTVEGNVMAEYDLAETIQNQLLRIKGRNASLEFS